MLVSCQLCSIIENDARMTQMTHMTQMTQMTGWQKALQTIDRMVYLDNFIDDWLLLN